GEERRATGTPGLCQARSRRRRLCSEWSGARVFFFQAEDGIRDFHVTGVQTCALPISGVSRSSGDSAFDSSAVAAVKNIGRLTERSEERRVGKECRSRGGPDQEKKEDSTGGG